MKYDISIIYVYYNTPKELLSSVESVFHSNPDLKIQIIVINNNSRLRIPNKILSLKNILVVKNKENKGYGKALNQGAKLVKSSNLILANPDTIFLEKSVKFLLKKLNDKKVGVVGPQMLSPEGKILPTINHNPSIKSLIFSMSFLNKLFPNSKEARKFWMKQTDRSKEHGVYVLSGACMAIRKEVFNKIEGFDEQFFMYFEEQDLCLRIKKIGLEVVYLPTAKIIHKIGASSSDKEWIEEKFQQSRFRFLKKYNSPVKALFAELFFRMTTFNSLVLLLAIISSVFLNLYKINNDVLFIGDFGRDYLAARDMILTGKIPLVGIPSSVVWLHQGPLSIYFIALSLLIGKFNPIAPAIFYAILGIITVYFVYLLGKNLFNKKVGAFSAIFFATSPLIVMSARMPYHTSSIPFFAATFFLFVSKIIKGNKKLLSLASFNLGILMLLELSNAVIFVVVALLLFIKRPIIKRHEALVSIIAFLLGICPFIIYDLTHHFVQTLGLPLWILNRIRLFLGFATPGKVTTSHLPSALFTIIQQLAGIIFPTSLFVFIIISLLFLILLATKWKTIIDLKKLNGLHILLLWLFVPLVGYLIHAAPGTAYFPLLFPAAAILVGLTTYVLFIKSKLLLVAFFIVCIINSMSLISHDYYLTTENNKTALPPFNYNYGISLSLQHEATKALVRDAEGKEFKLEGGGFLATLKTGIDNYEYLVWYDRGNVSNKANISYTVYEDKNAIKSKSKIIFSNSIVYITKNESN